MTTTATIEYDSRKFQELLLYIAEESLGDANFGKTKLNKILYYIDFNAYGLFGRPITGAEYQRRPHGPVPRQVTSARNELLQNGDAYVETVQRFNYAQERLVAKRPPNLSLFSNDEKALIDAVIADLRCKTGTEVSDQSHTELGWRLAKDGEVIPYTTVFLSARPMNEDDVRRGQEVYAILRAGAETMADVESITAGAA